MNDTAQSPLATVPQATSSMHGVPQPAQNIQSQTMPIQQEPTVQAIPGPQPHPHIPTMTQALPVTTPTSDPAISLPHKEYAPPPMEVPLQDVMEVHKEPELAPALLEVGVEHSADVQAEKVLTQNVAESDIEFAKESVPHPQSPSYVAAPSLPTLPKSRQEVEEEVKNLPTTSSTLWKAVLLLKLWKERLLPKSTV